MVAQFELAECYDKGNGLTQDYEQAAVWFEKAATQGHMRAQSSVAYMHEIGQGVTPDAKRAAHWYLKAAQQGDVGRMGSSARSGQTSAIDAEVRGRWGSLPKQARAAMSIGICVHPDNSTTKTAH